MNIEEFAEYSQSNCLKIERILERFSASFSIGHLTYSSHDQGYSHFLTANPDRLRLYGKHKLYELDELICHPDNLQEGVVLWSTLSRRFQRKYAGPLNECSQSRDGLTLITRSDESPTALNYFSMSFKRNDSSAINHMLSNLDPVKKFFRYFLSESQDLLKDLKNDPYNLAEAKGKKFYDSASFNADLCSKERKLFLSQVQGANLFDRSPRVLEALSFRERQCVQLFLCGKSAAATGQVLRLSRRTVEHYLDSARSKLNFEKKSEFFDLLKRPRSST